MSYASSAPCSVSRNCYAKSWHVGDLKCTLHGGRWLIYGQTTLLRRSNTLFAPFSINIAHDHLKCTYLINAYYFKCTLHAEETQKYIFFVSDMQRSAQRSRPQSHFGLRSVNVAHALAIICRFPMLSGHYRKRVSQK